MKKRFAKIRQLNKSDFFSAYLVENVMNPGKYYELKIFNQKKQLQQKPAANFNKTRNGNSNNCKAGGAALVEENIISDDERILMQTINYNQEYDYNAAYNNNGYDYEEEIKDCHHNSHNKTGNSEFLTLISKLTELRHPFISQYYEMSVQSGIVYVCKNEFLRCFERLD